MPNLPNLPKISLTRNQIFIAGAILAVIVVVVVLFMLGGTKGSKLPPVTIKVWGTDPDEVFQPIAVAYKALRPNATVEYKVVPEASYDQTVLTALAAGNGPDVFLIGNHDVLKRGDLISPAPPEQATIMGMQEVFPQAAIQDLVNDGKIYGTPLYMDTLALAYNKQMFDQGGIATPPATWDELIGGIPRLRVLDVNGRIVRAAIAVGGSDKSVDHAADILSLLMLQNGTVMA